MTVTLKRIGGSLAVVIPRAIAVESGLAEGASLDLSRTSTGILLRQRNRRPRRSVAAIAKQLKPDIYARRSAEILSVAPAGKEID